MSSFLEVLLQSFHYLGREGWSWAYCYLLHELICLFICFWLIAHLQLCEKWQCQHLANSVPCDGHPAQQAEGMHWIPANSSYNKVFWLMAEPYGADKTPLTLLPNMLYGLWFMGVCPGHKTEKHKHAFIKVLLWLLIEFTQRKLGKSSEISKEKFLKETFLQYREVLSKSVKW